MRRARPRRGALCPSLCGGRYPPSGNYSIAGLPPLAASDARQMPVYQDANRLMVGVDQGASYFDTFTVGNSIARIEHDLAGALPVVGERDDVEVRHGRIPDAPMKARRERLNGRT